AYTNTDSARSARFRATAVGLRAHGRFSANGYWRQVHASHAHLLRRHGSAYEIRQPAAVDCERARRAHLLRRLAPDNRENDGRPTLLEPASAQRAAATTAQLRLHRHHRQTTLQR